jgi:hypothetical protein
MFGSRDKENETVTLHVVYDVLAKARCSLILGYHTVQSASYPNCGYKLLSLGRA